ncbi:MAG: bifunctional methylenetetrahydrofolate dehydrogenase/methenyltetrahydrofolate cyclohydrolase FolD [Candidatus Sumerlaeia bacterium]
MTASLIDGKAMRDAIIEECQKEAQELHEKTGIMPGLVVILVGEDPASQYYVNSKKKTCLKMGWYSEVIEMPDTSTLEEVAEQIKKLNADDRVHGILLQLPLPKGLDEQYLLELIDPEKDVDGFHPRNFGRLGLGLPSFIPCTPKGVIEMLKRENIQTRGKRVVIAGRSNIVGKPLTFLLTRKGEFADATVTVVHSRTQNMAEVCKEADVLISAMGQPEMINADYVKPGAVVIDVGINRVDDASRPRGYRLCGDVDFESVKEVASAITPVPGGVGPMTIAMLMSNTLESAKRKAGVEI